MSVCLSIEGLRKTYPSEGGALAVLANLAFKSPKSEFLTIIGPSGCGKSTLLKIIAGLLDADGGVVEIDGISPREHARRRETSIVFQNSALMPWRTVEENVRLPLEVGAPRKGQDVGELLEMLGLSRFKRSMPHQLSGGMRQRAALARALVTRPSILLMDEPFGALDEITRGRMNMELLRVWRDERSPLSNVVFVTHSLQEAVLLSDRIIVLSERPARVKAIIDVKLDRPRGIESEDTKEFSRLRKELRSRLQ